MDTFTVRAYPGRTIADSPCILAETLRTDFKTTDTAPAERLFLFTAVTAIVFPSSAASFCCVLSTHDVSTFFFIDRLQFLLQPFQIGCIAGRHRCR